MAVEHLSAEVTLHDNTEFMNNTPQGIRATVRDKTSGFVGGQARGTALEPVECSPPAGTAMMGVPRREGAWRARVVRT